MGVNPGARRKQFRRFPPSGIPSVDVSQSITQGMTSCFVALSNGIIVDALLPRGIATGTQVTGPRGAGVTAATVSAAATPGLNWSSGPFSAAVWANNVGASNGVGYFSREAYVDEGNNQGWAIQFRVDGTPGYTFIIENNGASATYKFSDGGSFSAGDVMVGVGSDGTANKYIYVNGVQTAHSTSANFVPASSSGTLKLGLTTSGPTFTTYVYIACTWNRLLSATEHFQFYDDPRSFLIYPEDRIFAAFAAAAVAGGFKPGWASSATRTIGGVF